MKKMIIAFMVALVSVNSNAFEDLQSMPPSLYLDEKRTAFLDANSSDEQIIDYTQKEEENEKKLAALSDEELNIEEYDQNVTDNVTSPKVSTAEAMIRQALGELLIRYLNLKEAASTYFAEIKDALFQWYQNMVKAQ